MKQFYTKNIYSLVFHSILTLSYSKPMVYIYTGIYEILRHTLWYNKKPCFLLINMQLMTPSFAQAIGIFMNTFKNIFTNLINMFCKIGVDFSAVIHFQCFPLSQSLLLVSQSCIILILSKYKISKMISKGSKYLYRILKIWYTLNNLITIWSFKKKKIKKNNTTFVFISRIFYLKIWFPILESLL